MDVVLALWQRRQRPLPPASGEGTLGVLACAVVRTVEAAAAMQPRSRRLLLLLRGHEIFKMSSTSFQASLTLSAPKSMFLAMGRPRHWTGHARRRKRTATRLKPSRALGVRMEKAGANLHGQ